jgi:nucleoside-diphosphate-sugar epimerase
MADHPDHPDRLDQASRPERAQQAGVVVVTGSSGYIGAAVVRRLGERHRIVGFDRPGLPHPPPPAETVDCDVTQDDSVARALETVWNRHGGRIAAVIHLAAYYDFSGEPSPLYEQVTVRGTERLLRGLRRFHVQQFVFSSTMLVHAPCEPGQRIDEDWPLDPRWDYPRSKVKTENLIRAQCLDAAARPEGSLPVVVLRIAGVYDDHCRSIPLAHQIQRIYERRLTSYVFPGDTSHGQSFVHLDDLVEAIALAVERRATLPPETTLLIGEPETLSYEDLQRAFGQLLHGEEWETRQIPKALAKAGAWFQDVAHEQLGAGDEPFIKPWMIDLADDHYALDTTRARSLLGWEPRRGLRATLPRMVAALKADPAGWYKENRLEAAETDGASESGASGRAA